MGFAFLLAETLEVGLGEGSAASALGINPGGHWVLSLHIGLARVHTSKGHTASLSGCCRECQGKNQGHKNKLSVWLHGFDYFERVCNCNYLIRFSFISTWDRLCCLLHRVYIERGQARY